VREAGEENMNLKKIGQAWVFIFVVFVSIQAGAHEMRVPVILDTDMALDDVRTLILLLNSPHVQIKGIVTSDGSSSARIGYENLIRLLEFLHIKNIPVATGKSLQQPEPPWREVSEALGWAELPEAPHTGTPEEAYSLISRVTQASDESVTYICLGPLTNLAEALSRNPSLEHRISSIVFSGTPPDWAEADWNTARDLAAARRVFSSGMTIYCFHLKAPDLLSFDKEFLEDVEKGDSASSDLFTLLHRDQRIRTRLEEGHFQPWDETIAIYLHDPSVGSFQKVEGRSALFVLSGWDREGARNTYLEMLSGQTEKELTPRIPVVLNRYPTNPNDFREDIKPLIPDIIGLHGVEEFKAVLLTNELHRHLGTYSILGAKMGIRARELLGASLDGLHVESEAGLKPPLSCMNDGLQVATGASLGRGTIRVLNGSAKPAARFSDGQRMLRLQIRDDVLQAIRSDIDATTKRFGTLTPEYFQEVRRLSLKYWVDMDRRKVFDATFENPSGGN
jgi:pyrimidine-specific ribonucleoside hydrolase